MAIIARLKARDDQQLYTEYLAAAIHLRVGAKITSARALTILNAVHDSPLQQEDIDQLQTVVAHAESLNNQQRGFWLADLRSVLVLASRTDEGALTAGEAAAILGLT